jgi:hypothetical protein
MKMCCRGRSTHEQARVTVWNLDNEAGIMSRLNGEDHRNVCHDFREKFQRPTVPDIAFYFQKLKLVPKGKEL